MADYYLKCGDTGQTVSDILYDPDGEPINLGGASVVFKARRQGLVGALDIERACTTTSTQGEVVYTPDADDVVDANAGEYNQEWEITTSGLLVITVPNLGYNTLTISRQLGA
jgi:hypothetical protein